MYDTSENKQGNVLSWLALLIGSVALVISIAAYNRAGRDLNDLVKETTNKTIEQTSELKATLSTSLPTMATKFVETAQQTSARIALEAKLVALRTKIVVNTANVEVAEEVAMMRSEYKKAYDSANMESKQQAAIVDSRLSILEQDLRAGTANTLASLESAIESLRIDVENEE